MTLCPDCRHPHLPMPGKWKASDGTVINPFCDWPEGPDSCQCHRRRIGTRALASQRSDGLGRSERAEERSGPDLAALVLRATHPIGGSFAEMPASNVEVLYRAAVAEIEGRH